MEILSIVRSLNLPDCLVAAGFVRNLVWDSIHSKKTALNDIDVIFYDSSDCSNDIEQQITEQLNRAYPDFLWEATNQAFIHTANGDRPYKNTLDAMSYWPEKETAIGVSLNADNSINIESVFGLETLFAGEITYNPKRSIDTFQQRVRSKKWLEIWPNLRTVL
ncbi:nucleotidyltransferase family protein [Parendozoicomonas haliclonae]|uniref:Nitrate reductase n=1 Tax=Parendozoicomonas haliclonae TaxID=1960125 RepID=A0A1X7AMC2_9GAMM|nr:nucleotidyltransferase family protein [Parendozoicomonas haliclonae]SMA48905.1 hypothetical protein EHSB41UT_02964 [Parendozoicomonas haliclonae]